jgi:hypothetical protein
MTKNIDSTMYEVIVQEDPENGELLIPLPPELMTQMGWKEGDTFDFNQDDEGRIIIMKRP